MRLHPCPPPAGPLEAAPVTALRLEEAGEWEGFWAGNDAYYARLTRLDGAESWYQVMAEEAELLRAATRRTTPRAVPAVPAGAAPAPSPGRTLRLVGRQRPNAALTLVWGSRRRP